MPHNRASAGERVAAGLGKITPGDPGWWREDVQNAIDLDTFDMSVPSRSILGQRFGSVDKGLERLDLTRDEAVGYGFIALDDGDALMLDQLWLVNLISSRAEAKSRPPVSWPAGPADDPPRRWHL